MVRPNVEPCLKHVAKERGTKLYGVQKGSKAAVPVHRNLQREE